MNGLMGCSVTTLIGLVSGYSGEGASVRVVLQPDRMIEQRMMTIDDLT